MRARSLKPALFKNEVLGAADPLYTILFEGLWCEADRDGRLEDRPLRLRAEIFPYRHDADVDAMLKWLSDHGFISRYIVSGQQVIQILKFSDHQRPHANEVSSVLPAEVKSAPRQGRKQAQPRVKALATKDASTSLLISDSPFLTPDSGPLDSASGRGVNGKVPLEPIENLIPEGCDREAIGEWQHHREAHGKPLRGHELIAVGKTIASFGSALQQRAAVRNCIANGWKNLRVSDGPNGTAHIVPEAVKAWDRLIETSGAARDQTVQRALDKIGGWLRIQQRTTHESQRIRQEFCEAYAQAVAA